MMIYGSARTKQVAVARRSPLKRGRRPMPCNDGVFYTDCSVEQLRAYCRTYIQDGMIPKHENVLVGYSRMRRHELLEALHAHNQMVQIRYPGPAWADE